MRSSIIKAFTIGFIWRYARSLLNLSCAVQNGDDRSKYADDGCFFLSYINSAMFIGFRNSWAYLFNNDPGCYLYLCFNQETSSWNLKNRGCHARRVYFTHPGSLSSLWWLDRNHRRYPSCQAQLLTSQPFLFLKFWGISIKNLTQMDLYMPRFAMALKSKLN